MMEILDFVCGHITYLLWLTWVIYKWWFILSMVVFVFLVVMCKVADPLSSFTYKAKFVLIYYSCIMGTGLLWPVFALRPFNVANTNICGVVVRNVAYFVDMTYEVRGIDILEKDTGAVILANHQLSLDIFLMIQLFPVIPNYTGVSKKEILYVFPFGPASWLAGIVFIDRKNKKSAYATLARCKNLMNDKNVKILMFPEGTRNQNGSFLPFKKGAFNMAIETQSPIIPLVVSPYYFIDHKKQVFDKGHLILQALEPISTVGLTLADVDELAEHTREIMLKEFEKLTEECQRNFADPVFKNKRRPIMTTVPSKKKE